VNLSLDAYRALRARLRTRAGRDYMYCDGNPQDDFKQLEILIAALESHGVDVFLLANGYKQEVKNGSK
jgi:hypothetical protein